jgi:hypothetical protein
MIPHVGHTVTRRAAARDHRRVNSCVRGMRPQFSQGGRTADPKRRASGLHSLTIKGPRRRKKFTSPSRMAARRSDAAALRDRAMRNSPAATAMCPPFRWALTLRARTGEVPGEDALGCSVGAPVALQAHQKEEIEVGTDPGSNSC